MTCVRNRTSEVAMVERVCHHSKLVLISILGGNGLSF